MNIREVIESRDNLSRKIAQDIRGPLGAFAARNGLRPEAASRILLQAALGIVLSDEGRGPALDLLEELHAGICRDYVEAR